MNLNLIKIIDLKTDSTENEDYDKRKPGLFKLEWEGNGMTALCSKTYYCWGGKDKFSSKGIQQDSNKEILNKESYLKCLDNEETICQNKGFRFIDKTMKTYEQDKIGLSPIYIKGVVMEGGIHVRPLDI